MYTSKIWVIILPRLLLIDSFTILHSVLDELDKRLNILNVRLRNRPPTEVVQAELFCTIEELVLHIKKIKNNYIRYAAIKQIDLIKKCVVSMDGDEAKREVKLLKNLFEAYDLYAYLHPNE